MLKGTGIILFIGLLGGCSTPASTVSAPDTATNSEAVPDGCPYQKACTCGSIEVLVAIE